MKSPLRHHNKNHGGIGQPLETCWFCGRDRAKCRSKLRFTSWEEANEWVMESNVSRGWEPPHMTRYRCRWCEGVAHEDGQGSSDEGPDGEAASQVASRAVTC